jgi:hypothetical protein
MISDKSVVLEQISGGAFNPEAVSKCGVDVKTGKHA